MERYDFIQNNPYLKRIIEYYERKAGRYYGIQSI